LAVGFADLLAEATHSFHDVLSFDVPVSLILTPVGFLLVFFIEKVIFLGSDCLETNESNESLNDDDSLLSKSYSSDSFRRLQKLDPLGHHAHVQLTTTNKVLPFLLLFILSFHGFLAGIVLGLQNTINEFTTILGAILSHQWIEAFALGVSMLRNEVRVSKLIKCVILYSIMVPVGLGLGTIVSYFLSGKVEVWVRASLTSVASGTFIYVAVCDILMEEFSEGKSNGKYWKFAILMFGFVLLCGVKVVFDSGLGLFNR